MQRLALQIITGAGFIYGGVLSHSTGQLALFLSLASCAGMTYLQYRSATSKEIYKKALESTLGPDFKQSIDPNRQAVLRTGSSIKDWARPFDMKRTGVKRITNISYGDAAKRRNLLDIYQPTAAREGGYPVLLQVHGGAWIIGNKEQQALPLMYHLAQRGWICISINYRLSPTATFPDHIVDVKKAIAWIRQNISEYGGNSDYFAITGGSAGGHLSSLAALTPNKAEFQPGFEDLDTSIDAAVPFYGIYDFLDRHHILGSMGMEKQLAKLVFKSSPQEQPELWDSMCSESQINSKAPPFFIIHGTHDSLAFEEAGEAFANALGASSENPVAYASVEGAQHAFEIFHSLRTENTINAVTEFLEWSYADKKRKPI